MKIERFEDIDAWKSARQLVKEVYEKTSRWPYKQRSLADQMERAAVSSMANIAEGFDATSDADFTRFLMYARQSVTELQSHLYVASDQKYIHETEFKSLYEIAHKSKNLIGGFIRYLKGKKV